MTFFVGFLSFGHIIPAVNPAVVLNLPIPPFLPVFVSVSRKVRLSPPTKCPAECSPSLSHRTAATSSPQETDTSSSGTWTPPKNDGYPSDLLSANHSSAFTGLKSAQPITAHFAVVWTNSFPFFFSFIFIIFSMYPGEQHGASDWSVRVARRP